MVKVNSKNLVLHPAEDTQIGFHDRMGSANQNAGNADCYGTLWQPATCGSGENGGRGLMKFNLASFSNGSQIISAHLNLYGRGLTVLELRFNTDITVPMLLYCKGLHHHGRKW